MIKSLFATKDATIYKDINNLNTGLDEIIELRKTLYKINTGSIAETFYSSSYISLSRILIKFDITDISSSVASGLITSPKYYLKLNVTEAKRLQTAYTIEAYPVSQSWTMGSGKKHSNPIIDDGVSWNYKDSGSLWSSTGSTWYTDYSGSQTFNYESADLLMDVTNIVNAWVSGTIPNEGFVVKFSQAIETSSAEYGSLNFFSRDTNTIYPPLLQAKWDDSSYSTGSLTAVDINNMTVNISNLRPSYKIDEISRLNVFVRDRFPSRTYVEVPRYLVAKYLPTSSYYSVMDAHTAETIIPFDSQSTKLSSDASGSYFNFDMSGLQPERYYKFVLKFQNSTNTTIIDNKFYFKVER